jgi:uncharacterized membrane protein YphA (DoxX/SURF4 family)
MTLSQSAAANFVPLLARIVLVIAFLPTGYNKLMKDTEFSGDQAKRLRELQVVSSARDPHDGLRFATLVQTAPAGAATPPSQPTTSEQPPKPEIKDPTAASGAASGGVTGEPIRARNLYSVALMVDRIGWPYPVPMAWAAAVTELLGAICLLVGLFTRLWGLALAGVMAVAFYLTSLEAVQATWVFGMNLEQYTRFALQLALFALAFGLVLTGAGSLSLDRMMARGGGGGPAKKKPATE